MIKLALAILLFLALTHYGSARCIADLMISDAIYNATTTAAAAAVPMLGASTVTCEPPYGFLPCTTELPGLIFLVVVYQYLLSLGQKYVSEGSDLFFQTFGPGVFGASLFHFIGTIPQIALILVSRLSGDAKNAKAQAGIGMSILAGGAVTNLTLTWGVAVGLASYKFSQAPATIDTTVQLKKPSRLTGSGVITDIDTSYTARIVMISVIPLLILQLTNVVSSSSGSHLIVLISLIVTLGLLISYNLYQIFQPWIQKRRFEYLTQKFVKDKLQVLLTSNGRPNAQLIRQIFHGIDKNKDGYISPAELRVLIIGIKLEDDGFIRGDYADKVKEAFDMSGDSNINEEEFVAGLSKYLLNAQQPAFRPVQKVPNTNGNEGQSLLVQGNSAPSAEDPWKNYIKAAYLILLGTAISVLLALPLIQSVVGVATATKIPPFFIPYVVIPLTLASRSVGRTISSAKQKTPESISLTLSQIYGSVFMSNMMGLTTFLLVVFVRDIPVDASAEFLVAIVICTGMGVFTGFRTAFPLWTSYLVILMYPISLVTLYVLTTVLGWS
ncbi:sodium/calcium exchanger NCL [Heracleum sosnowskyi]|uniref:Sodium/calcium exchanger NCL n=1 Tax=Heracleum sosnowskyi TaxID=360622 RepID=A0AAD8I568_9APIA|nr:sodium/calcium exchanger NCL [Heracleum sosnowskyi]